MKAPHLQRVLNAIDSLIADVRAHKVAFGTGQTYDHEGKPCCALGHLFARCGLAPQNNFETVRPLVAALGLSMSDVTEGLTHETWPLVDRLATFARGIWSTNDMSLYANMQSHEFDDRLIKALTLFKSQLQNTFTPELIV